MPGPDKAPCALWRPIRFGNYLREIWYNGFVNDAFTDRRPTMKTTESNLPAILPALYSLSRADKLRVIQHLANDLAKEEDVPFFEAGGSDPIWTPLEAYEAGATLMKFLEAEKARP